MLALRVFALPEYSSLEVLEGDHDYSHVIKALPVKGVF